MPVSVRELSSASPSPRSYGSGVYFFQEKMIVLLWAVATIGATWILALFSDSQAAIAGAIVMTFAVLGVLAIYWLLNRAQC